MKSKIIRLGGVELELKKLTFSERMENLKKNIQRAKKHIIFVSGEGNYWVFNKVFAMMKEKLDEGVKIEFIVGYILSMHSKQGNKLACLINHPNFTMYSRPARESIHYNIVDGEVFSGDRYHPPIGKEPRFCYSSEDSSVIQNIERETQTKKANAIRVKSLTQLLCLTTEQMQKLEEVAQKEYAVSLDAISKKEAKKLLSAYGIS